ncbi:MAG: hypothetical protein RLZZ546_2745 [Bacteroidota bacterium]|jgi:hypothetical protein
MGRLKQIKCTNKVMRISIFLTVSFFMLNAVDLSSQQYPLLKLNERIEKVGEVRVITSHRNSKDLREKLKLLFETLGSDYEFKNNIDSTLNAIIPFETNLKEIDKEFKTKFNKQKGYLFTIVSPDGLCKRNCLRILLVNYKSERQATCDCKKFNQDENLYNPFNNLCKCYYQNGALLCLWKESSHHVHIFQW